MLSLQCIVDVGVLYGRARDISVRRDLPPIDIRLRHSTKESFAAQETRQQPRGDLTVDGLVDQRAVACRPDGQSKVAADPGEGISYNRRGIVLSAGPLITLTVVIWAFLGHPSLNVIEYCNLDGSRQAKSQTT